MAKKTIDGSAGDAYDAGRRLAEQQATRDFDNLMAREFRWVTVNYQGAEELDLMEELRRFYEDRMASHIDLTKYPECRGMRELVEAHRKGFTDVCGDQAIAAYCMDWYWFISRRLNTRFVGRQAPPARCTDFWFGDSVDGGPIHGTNRDDVLFRYTNGGRRERGPMGTMKPSAFTEVTCVGGVSAAVLCDEEPECLFPVDMGALIPDGITDVKEYVGYLERYREFWGPGNQIWVDPQLNFASLEKANVRMGVRYGTGCAAITACAYLTPEMNAFKRERDLASFEARGWPAEDNRDHSYWSGCERRYRRLLDLVEKENRRGASMVGAAHICLDHAVPFPDRVCLAGEKGHRDEEDDVQNWTMISGVSLKSGPNLRSYHWEIDPDDPVPIYRTECGICPGEGLESRVAGWRQDLRDAGELGLPATD